MVTVFSIGAIGILSVGYNRLFSLSSASASAGNFDDFSSWISVDGIVYAWLSGLQQYSLQHLSQQVNYWDDTSLYRYVSRKYPFSNRYYVPADLINIKNTYLVTREKLLLRENAAYALYDLAHAFYKQFWKKLLLVSAYRSFGLQKHMVNEWCSAAQCAAPWTSEHQAGLAIDIHVSLWNGKRQSLGNTENRYYEWLQQHAHQYGFHNTYQKGIATDGQMEEGWHWRYVWVQLATYLYEHDLSFAQWYEEQKK